MVMITPTNNIRLFAFLLLFASISAYIYLNKVDIQKLKKEAQALNVKDSPASRKGISLLPERGTNGDSSPEENRRRKEQNAPDKYESTPDVLFLKFLIRKGREGMPVLNFKSFLFKWL
jgi:hypothetical protein